MNILPGIFTYRFTQSNNLQIAQYQIIIVKSKEYLPSMKLSNNPRTRYTAIAKTLLSPISFKRGSFPIAVGNQDSLIIFTIDSLQHIAYIWGWIINIFSSANKSINWSVFTAVVYMNLSKTHQHMYCHWVNVYCEHSAYVLSLRKCLL